MKLYIALLFVLASTAAAQSISMSMGEEEEEPQPPVTKSPSVSFEMKIYRATLTLILTQSSLSIYNTNRQKQAKWPNLKRLKRTPRPRRCVSLTSILGLIWLGNSEYRSIGWRRRVVITVLICVHIIPLGTQSLWLCLGTSLLYISLDKFCGEGWV